MNGVSGTNPGTRNNILVGAVTCLPAVGCTDSTTNYDPVIIDDGYVFIRNVLDVQIH